MEHDTLQGAFVVGGVAAIAATALAVVMLVSWARGRRCGRPVAMAGLAFLVSAALAVTSAGWLTYQRHEKCGRTVARTLCESPIDWIRSR
jgi:hypothetical protein